jgi:acetyl coenzyme A synthetase (ADP forming)-like protein
MARRIMTTDAAVLSPRVSPPTLTPFFLPRTIAVVGAGRTRGGIGAEIYHNLVSHGFRGRVFAVNPHGTTVDGSLAYRAISAIPASVDMAVIAVPCAAVETAVDECLGAGVPAITVISAGFAETGDAGRQREVIIRDKVRRAGARMIGPNCMGLLNTDPAISMNATFAPGFPPAGSIAFSSQSGALGVAILEGARTLNLGLSSFVSVGNKADVSGNDLLEYWESDPRTSVILLYLESFGNPTRFGELARRIGRTKPIVAVKAGRSRSGARAASSHTGALAASDTPVEALFRDSGVVRTETVEELFHVGALLAHQPLPAGPRVAILTNAGGPGILAADACEANGLSLANLSAQTTEALAAFLPPAASVRNPVDMIASASADDYRRALPLLLADPEVDSVITIFIPPIVTRADAVAQAIAASASGSRKPVLATFFGAAGVPAALAPVPCYTFPEAAAGALARVVEYAKWRAAPVGIVPELAGIDRVAARAVVDSVRSAGGGWLDPLATSVLLESVGLTGAPTCVVMNRDGAVEASNRVGYPVVLKGMGPALLHKTESHAVHVNLGDEEEMLAAFHALDRRPDVEQIVVQPMVRDGAEMFIGVSYDPLFGHLVMCGSGGTLLELMRDTSARLAPVTDRGASEMIEEIHGRLLLRGFRGAPPRDEAAYREAILRVSAMVRVCPEIEELDLNPVIVTTNGAVVVDARVKVRGERAAHGTPQR